MKSVMLNCTYNEWNDVANGKLTGVVSRTAPSVNKIDVPFKVYIYCPRPYRKVVAECVCTNLQKIRDDMYQWYLDNIQIYDEFKDVTSFTKPCPNNYCCFGCNYRYPKLNITSVCSYRSYGGELKRAPQVWCYVEDASGVVRSEVTITTQMIG